MRAVRAEDNEEHVNTMYSTSPCPGSSNNYPVHELELLAIVHVVRTFWHYLEGCKHFTLFTDHHSL